MQAVQDIFQIWPSVRQMAEGIGREYDTVLRWRIRGRIPEDSWDDVIRAAAAADVQITADQLLAINAPMKQRGRPRLKRRRAR